MRRIFTIACLLTIIGIGFAGPIVSTARAAGPYGGCKEAYTMPHSEQSKKCAAKKYLRITCDNNDNVDRYLRRLDRAYTWPQLRRATRLHADATAVIGRRYHRMWAPPKVEPKVERMSRLTRDLARKWDHLADKRGKAWVRYANRVVKPASNATVRQSKRVRHALDLGRVGHGC